MSSVVGSSIQPNLEIHMDALFLHKYKDPQEEKFLCLRNLGGF